MNDGQNKRKLFILAGAVDAVLSGIVLLLYFGLLPVDISGWGIPRRVIGVVGGAWFLSAIAILAHPLSRPDVSD
jgi:hypothetical protein